MPQDNMPVRIHGTQRRVLGYAPLMVISAASAFLNPADRDPERDGMQSWQFPSKSNACDFPGIPGARHGLLVCLRSLSDIR